MASRSYATALELHSSEELGQMTASVHYWGPMRQKLVSPTEDDIRTLLFETPEAYWQDGSCNGTFFFKSDGIESELSLSLTDPYGFRITHVFLPKRDMHVCVSSPSFDELTSVLIGGSFTALPVALFVPREDAFRVVVEFCNTGKRSSTVDWARWHDLEWEDPGDFDDEQSL